MGISKLFYRAPVYKFSRFDLPINFDYPADLFLITEVISTFKMQFILSEMLAMGFFRDLGQPPALNILELLAGSPLALLHQANTQGSYGTRGCRRKPCSLKPPHRLVAAKNQWPALPAAPAVYPITPWNEPWGVKAKLNPSHPQDAELWDTDLHVIASWLVKRFWFCTKTFITWCRIVKV